MYRVHPESEIAEEYITSTARSKVKTPSLAPPLSLRYKERNGLGALVHKHEASYVHRVPPAQTGKIMIFIVI